MGSVELVSWLQVDAGVTAKTLLADRDPEAAAKRLAKLNSTGRASGVMAVVTAGVAAVVTAGIVMVVTAGIATVLGVTAVVTAGVTAVVTVGVMVVVTAACVVFVASHSWLSE